MGKPLHRRRSKANTSDRAPSGGRGRSTSGKSAPRPIEKHPKKKSDFRELADLLPAAVFECDTTGVLTYANRYAFEYLNYTEEEFSRGFNVLDAIAPEDRTRAAERMADILRGGTVIGGEYTAVRKDRSTFPVIIYSSRIVRDGRVVGMRGVVADITERKHAETCLLENEERLRSIVEHSTHLFYSHTPEYVFTYLSPQVRDLLGYEPSEAPARWTDLLTDHSKNDRAREIKKAAVETGVRQPPYEAELVAKDGRLVLVEVSETPVVRDGETTSVVGAARDITERKRTLDELQRLAAVIRNSSDLIYLATPDGRMVFLNEAGAAMLGIPVSEAADHSIYDVIHEDYLELVSAEIVPTILRGDRWEGDLQYKNLETGERCDVHAVTFLISDPASGAPLCMANISRDISDRKKAEQAVIERQARLNSIFRAAPIGIGVVANRVLLDVNNYVCEMTGYARDELIGKSARMLYPTEAEFEFVGVEKHRQIMENGIGRVDTVWRRKDGTVIDVHLSSAPIVGGEPASGITFTAVDITERKRSERALREALTRFESIVEGTPIVAIQGFDRRGVIRHWNHASSMLYGYSTSEAVGERIQKLLAGATDIRAFKAAFKATWHEKRAAGPAEYQIRTRSGELRWVYSTMFPVLHEGEVAEIFCMDVDITDLKKAEEARRESERQYRLLVETLHEGIWVIDADARTTFVNPRMAEMLGYSVEEMKSKLIFEFMDAAVIDLSSEHLARLRKGAREQIEFEFIRKDGSRMGARVEMAPILDDKSAYIGAIAGIQDITELRIAEEERRRFEKKMRQAQKLESLGVLAGGVAHDFNNLLLAILGNLDLASSDIPRDSSARASLSDVERAARRAADLCRQLLDYSGHGHLEIRPLDLNAVIKDMSEILDVSTSKKASVKFDLSPDAPVIDADVTQIRQIVMNLIVNASEALDEEEGTIIVSTGTVGLSRRNLREMLLGEKLPEGRYAYVEVADTGIGMDEDTQSRMFDPFFTTKFAGRGLGLAAVLGIVRGHSGAIKLSSEPGVGTVFRAVFPLSSGHSAAEEKSAADEGEWRGSGTVLLVDDEEMVRAVGKRMLERLGFGVILASNGREAVEKFVVNQKKISCVILDLTMPRMDGVQTLGELRRISADACVILSSGYREREVAGRLAGKPHQGLIEKPYDIAKLSAAIRSALAAKVP